MSEDYAGGFTAGLLQAVKTLRAASGQHEAQSAGNNKIAESEGHRFAARLLRSYANGLEMDAERFASGSSLSPERSGAK